MDFSFSNNFIVIKAEVFKSGKSSVPKYFLFPQIFSCLAPLQPFEYLSQTNVSNTPMTNTESVHLEGSFLRCSFNPTWASTVSAVILREHVSDTNILARKQQIQHCDFSTGTNWHIYILGMRQKFRNERKKVYFLVYTTIYFPALKF